MDLPEKIKYLREKEELSQSKFAEKIFVSRQAVSRWENARTQPEVDTLKFISKTFDLPLEWLLTEEFDLDYLNKPTNTFSESDVTNDTNEYSLSDSTPSADMNAAVNQSSLTFYSLIETLHNKKLASIIFISLALFPALFFPIMLVVTIPLALIALLTDYSRIFINLIFTVITLVTFLELFAFLTLRFNWFTGKGVDEVSYLEDFTIEQYDDTFKEQTSSK